MSSFLSLLAKDLIAKFNCRFENVTIIFPNKRAGLFLAAEMTKLIDRPIWMPEIITISEFIEKHSGLKKADDLTAIIKLYKAYIDISGSQEKFDDFYFWGNMLLNDFDDIDKYIVDAKALFSNLTALKEIDFNFSFLTEEQTDAVKMFWSSFNSDQFSKEQQEFLKIWDKLYPTYMRFRKNMFENKLCYEGMGIRHFCEHIEEYEINEHIVFAGFNALNFAEQQIFRFFQDKKKASFYWDYDLYYTSNISHEAGRFIRENLRNFPNELGPEHFNNFKYNGKQIEYISVPSAIGQAKLIPTLLQNKEIKGHTDTAIVLCDEKMLVPAVRSIPEQVKKINITMGYPAQNTSIAAFIHLLSECKKYQKNKNGESYYYYKPVIALLNHKLVKSAFPEEIDKITEYIHKNNIVYVNSQHLSLNELCKSIFVSDPDNTPDYLLKIMDILMLSADQSISDIEKEFIFSLYTQIQSLKNTFGEESILPEQKLYIEIIRKLLQGLSVPFSGEPLEELQLMGLLETRMLDFKNIIILSANEGIMPKTSTASSFIPYNLRYGFQLPTQEHQDALFAYYFYRLLQRGKNIKIMYSTGSKGINSNEMSRYLLQIKYESGLPIRENNFQNNISVQHTRSISIAKSDNLLEELYKLSMKEGKKLSPSALNTYLECPVRFYFKYIEGIKEKEEVAEELDHRLLGNIFHECSESLYTLFGDSEIKEEDITGLLKNNQLLDKHIQQAYLNCYSKPVAQLIDSGSNELILNIIRKYIRKMLEYDKTFTPFRIISMEKEYSATIPIQTNKGEISVYLGGTIDRVDQNREGIRIIDYKTGSDTTGFKGIPSLFDTENKTRNKAAFQTLLYCLMYEYQHPETNTLIPGVYSIKSMFSKDYSHLLADNNNPVRAYIPYKEEFYNELKRLLEELYSSEKEFIQTHDENRCRTCAYKSICNK